MSNMTSMPSGDPSLLPPATYLNDIGDPTQHPLYNKLDDPRAQKAFGVLCKRQDDSAGRKDTNNNDLVVFAGKMTPEIMAANKGSPEQVYGRPSGNLCLSRSFFPDTKNISVDMRRYAALNIEKDSKQKESDEEDMHRFMMRFRNICSGLCQSKLLTHLINLLHENPIVLPGYSITTLADLKKEWAQDIPNIPLAEACFELFYKRVHRGTLNQLCWEIRDELRFWFACSDAEHDFTKCGNKATGPKRHMLHGLMATRYTDSFRKKYCSGPHGIGIKMSVGKDNTEARATFVYSAHVTGFKTKKHEKWVLEKRVLSKVCLAIITFR